MNDIELRNIRRKTLMKKINLGCGNQIRDGYLNIDYPEIDLNKRLPYTDNEFDYCLCENVAPYIKDLKNAVNEAKRISKKLTMNFPHFASNPPDRLTWGKVYQERFSMEYIWNLFKPDYIEIRTFIPKHKMYFRNKTILRIYEGLFIHFLRPRSMYCHWENLGPMNKKEVEDEI